MTTKNQDKSSMRINYSQVMKSVAKSDIGGVSVVLIIILIISFNDRIEMISAFLLMSSGALLIIMLHNIRVLFCIIDQKKGSIEETKTALLKLRKRMWGQTRYGDSKIFIEDCAESEIFSYTLCCDRKKRCFYFMTSEKAEKLSDLMEYASQNGYKCILQFEYYKWSKIILDIDLAEDVEYSEEFLSRWNEISQMV